MAGGRIFARAAADAIRDSGAATVRIVGSVASWITAVGVDAGLPASISARATPASRSTPIKKIAVSAEANAPQLMREPAFPGASCAVAIATDAAASRCVTGIPAAAGPAIADVMPGTTSNGMPAAASASASSPPRPNTNGSPPFNRTTERPARASRIKMRVISACVLVCCFGCLPT